MWLQVFTEQRATAKTKALEVLLSYNASHECHHNFNVQCHAQLKTVAATRAVSMHSSYDASFGECHHNFNVQCCAQLKTANTNTNKT